MPGTTALHLATLQGFILSIQFFVRSERGPYWDLASYPDVRKCAALETEKSKGTWNKVLRFVMLISGVLGTPENNERVRAEMGGLEALCCMMVKKLM